MVTFVLWLVLGVFVLFTIRALLSRRRQKRIQAGNTALILAMLDASGDPIRHVNEIANTEDRRWGGRPGSQERRFCLQQMQLLSGVGQDPYQSPIGKHMAEVNAIAPGGSSIATAAMTLAVPCPDFAVILATRNS